MLTRFETSASLALSLTDSTNIFAFSLANFDSQYGLVLVRPERLPKTINKHYYFLFPRKHFLTLKYEQAFHPRNEYFKYSSFPTRRTSNETTVVADLKLIHFGVFFARIIIINNVFGVQNVPTS